MLPIEMDIRDQTKGPPWDQAARGTVCIFAASPFGKPPCVLVGWSRFRAVLMLTGFYLRRRSGEMARKFGT